MFHRCHRLPGKGPNRPIICRFVSYEHRELVWGKKTALRNTKLFITESFPAEIEEKRRPLYPILRAAKRNKMKATIKYDKLIVEGVSYDCNSLDKLPEQLNPAKLSTVTKDQVTCFFTGSSPLSNFHVVKDGIDIDGIKYDCVERYFQMQRALFAVKPDTAQKIRYAKGPLQCKLLGDAVTLNEDEWLPNAERFMLKACRSKFQQHETCKSCLLSTGDTELAEAGPNKIWGIGLSMNHPEAFTKNWQGRNRLGVILKQVRDELKETESSS